MKFIILAALLIMSCSNAHSQNLIGYKGKDILKYMKENRREMNLNNVVNSQYSYLKYSDNQEKQTILFFLNKDSVCKSVRIICDLSIKTEKINELNRLYRKNGENRWIDKRDGKNYEIELNDGNWSSTISIESVK
jgi:hypothetical protein